MHVVGGVDKEYTVLGVDTERGGWRERIHVVGGVDTDFESE